MEGITIVGAGKKNGVHLSRMTQTVNNVYKKAKELDSDIYHFHDPELIPIGLKLKKLGKKVIFDAHKDLPKQLLGKPYLNKPLLTIHSKVVSLYETYSCRKFDYITATPYKFLSINSNSVDINNYPSIGELSNTTSWDEKNDGVCYVGGIAKIREIVKATRLIKLNLAVKFSKEDVEDEVKNVNEFGFLNQEDNYKYYFKSKIYISIPQSDSISISLVEAIICGSIPFDSNLELIDNAENGFIEHNLEGIDFSKFSNIKPAYFEQTRKKVKVLFLKECNKKKYVEIYKKLGA